MRCRSADPSSTGGPPVGSKTWEQWSRRTSGAPLTVRRKLPSLKLSHEARGEIGDSSSRRVSEESLESWSMYFVLELKLFRKTLIQVLRIVSADVRVSQRRR